MTWLEHHAAAERLAADAEVVTRTGDVARGRDLYSQAASEEMRALDDLDPSKIRTLSITTVSAVALFYKAEDFDRAAQLAHKSLGTGRLAEFATEQLQILLQAVWSEQVRQRAGVRFSPGEVVVSVKGGQVVHGGAPLDLIVRKVETLQSLFYRTTEFLKGTPHRRRGPAPQDIQELCRPWLFQTAPGSYQFAVAIEEPAQRPLFGTADPASRDIARTFLRILRAGAEDPDEGLIQVVPDPDYRATFLKLTRNLAPIGETFSELEIRSADEIRPVTLVANSRRMISESIRRQFPRAIPSGSVEEVTLRGVLRALHLDQDWLEITVDGQHVRIGGVSEAVDDVVGPMVNREVIVEAFKGKRDRYSFRDIQAAE